MKRIKELKQKTQSKKAHIPDHAKNDTFKEENTPEIKKHKGKVPHGKFYGKHWFPEN